MATPDIVDGKVYELNSARTICVQVVSGTPAMAFSVDDFTTSTALDLTVSPSYPNAAVKLPQCKYKFTLGGAVVKVTGLND